MRRRPQMQGLSSSIGDPEVDDGGIHQGSGSLRNFAEDFFDVQRGGHKLRQTRQRAQARKTRFQGFIEARIFNGHGRLGGKEGQQVTLWGAKDTSRAFVIDRDDAEETVTIHQGFRENRKERANGG